VPTGVRVGNRRSGTGTLEQVPSKRSHTIEPEDPVENARIVAIGLRIGDCADSEAGTRRVPGLHILYRAAHIVLSLCCSAQEHYNALFATLPI
jgi:hypothetical protein